MPDCLLRRRNAFFTAKRLRSWVLLFPRAQCTWIPTRCRLSSNSPPLNQSRRFNDFWGSHFICNFSLIAAPIVALTKKERRSHFSWNPEAEKAFEELKKRFSSKPVLVHPDSSLPFVVEVDASAVGVSAILSQYAQHDKSHHPCAYFSRSLSPAEWNYDVGDCELLAIKLPLEEWRHWLEGAEHPFRILTDHKNLLYIQQSKRRNARQAWWAMFFNRFDYVLTYRPGSKNVKPDALSRMFDPLDNEAIPKLVVLENRILAPGQWDIEREIHDALATNPDPGGGPRNRLFVPVRL